MNEITRRIRNEVLKDHKALIEQLASEGKEQYDIVRCFDNIIRGKIREFYKKNTFSEIGELLGEFKQKFKNNDSKAEIIFYKLLTDNKIQFKFQYKIGPYRADFLAGDDLIIEVDGPQHNKIKDDKRDKYLGSMGYRILRLPIWILSQKPDFIIEEIKKLLK